MNRKRMPIYNYQVVMGDPRSIDLENATAISLELESWKDVRIRR